VGCVSDSIFDRDTCLRRGGQWTGMAMSSSQCEQSNFGECWEPYDHTLYVPDVNQTAINRNKQSFVSAKSRSECTSCDGSWKPLTTWHPVSSSVCCVRLSRVTRNTQGRWGKRQWTNMQWMTRGSTGPRAEWRFAFSPRLWTTLFFDVASRREFVSGRSDYYCRCGVLTVVEPQR
jgi:hypothetical protein